MSTAVPLGDKPPRPQALVGIVRASWSGTVPAGLRLVRGGRLAAILAEDAAMPSTAARLSALTEAAAAGPVLACRPGAVIAEPDVESWLVAASDGFAAELDAVEDAKLIVVTWTGAASPQSPRAASTLEDARASGRAYLRAAAEENALRRLGEDLLRLEAEALAAELAPRVRRWRIVLRPERDGRPAAHLDLLIDAADADAEVHRLQASLDGRARITGPLPAFDALAGAVPDGGA